MMDDSCEAEQKQLQARSAGLEVLLQAKKDELLNMIPLLDPVKNYTDAPKIATEQMWKFIGKLLVFQYGKMDYLRVQRIRMIRNFSGEFKRPALQKTRPHQRFHAEDAAFSLCSRYRLKIPSDHPYPVL